MRLKKMKDLAAFIVREVKRATAVERLEGEKESVLLSVGEEEMGEV